MSSVGVIPDIEVVGGRIRGVALRQIGVRKRLPGLVVIGSRGVGNAPIGHGTIRVDLRHLLEATEL